MSFLGIDLGTSSVKIILINEKGDLLGEESRGYSVDYPKINWAEQNPEDWWKATKDCIKNLMEKGCCKKDTVKAIGFSGQMHGLVALDENDQVLHPAILWCDQRTQEECHEITNYFGQEKLTQYTGNKALTGFTAPKILWLKKHKPKLYEKIAHILLPKDYIRLKLTGEYATDVSDASGMLLLDVKKRNWSKEMLEFLQMKESVLPKLYESYEITGYLTEGIKNILGLKGEIAVVGGAGDQAAGAIGTGTVKEGIASVTLGTSGVVFASHNEYRVDKENRLHAFCHANGKYHSMGVMLSAASCLKWWVEEIHKGVAFEELLTEAENSPIGSKGLIFLPYLMGERTPYADPNAKGVFIGLTMSHSRGDMTRAILEGVAFGLRDSFQILKELKIPVEDIRAIGGGAQSNLWMDILTNVFDQKISTLYTDQGGALGAAILASVGNGTFDTVENACSKLIHVKKTYVPNKEKVYAYIQYYKMYHQLYDVLKASFDQLAHVQKSLYFI
ncbi:xylulokinase [Crassaminicella profunda]|uniref:xylulokinase n=1 Tax=Crassaminicella profunda TaxID=1286698 RepID=UPI001CA65A3A|nr:xylulokinase [Crassaminicella profunda]QZY54455.1 xylulokinase [Crassaminicella profunda]